MGVFLYQKQYTILPIKALTNMMLTDDNFFFITFFEKIITAASRNVIIRL